MKLTAIILLGAGLTASAKGISQTVTLDVKNAPVQIVFKEVLRQTGVSIIYNENLLKDAPPVTINVKNVALKEVLDLCLGNQDIEYVIKDNTIEVRKKVKSNNVFSETYQLPPPPIDIKGRVVNDKGQPVESALVTVKGTNKSVTTNANGEFTLTGIDANATLVVSAVNIETYEIKVGGKKDLAINVKAKITTGNEVIVEANNGYQKFKPNESTASINVITNEQLNRMPFTDILSRLQNSSSGLLFINGTETNGINQRDNILIRSIGTIFSNKNPLIILDNFPYEGEISNINPNDIESITILKDAAAASIWGSKSGNGVIVITTKSGKYNQKPNVTFSISIQQKEKPDLYYIPSLSSSDFIDVETYLFNQGFYNGSITSPSRPALTPAVDILLRRRNGQISSADSASQLDALRNIDVRKDLEKYYINRLLLQQYSINFAGGTSNHKYFLSAGYDYNLNNTSNYKRYTLNAGNTYSLLRNKLEVSTSIWGAQAMTDDFGASQYSFDYPYGKLADNDGNPLPIARYRQEYIDTAGGGKLLDWTYYPLKEKDYADNKLTVFNYNLNIGIRYKIIKGLDFDIKYQYGKQQTTSRNLYNLETFFARDLINGFTNLTQTNSSLRNPVPIGGILIQGLGTYTSQNFRAQINFVHTWNKKHNLNGIVGTDVGKGSTLSNSYGYYGYNDALGSNIAVDYVNNYPNYITGNNSRIQNHGNINGFYSRTVSVYANAAYTYKNRYTVFGSARRDGSNIFGATTNNKWKPLWSAGVKWDIDSEPFYKISWLTDFNFRATYGYQGNVNNIVAAALTTISAGSSLNRWRLPYSLIQNYPNPNLRWENIAQFNIGVDFKIKNNIWGSIEYYRKKGTDLIGDQSLPPSSGVSSTKTNTADIKGKGIDISINTRINLGPINWTASFLFGYAKDWVSNYKSSLTNILNYVGGGTNPIVGKPVSALYSYRWAGLDPLTGDPQGYIAGQLSKNYAQLVSSTNLSDMVYEGPQIPPYFGSILNTFRWKGLTLSATINYKFGYYFRRSSINYSNLISKIDRGHTDYTQRWQKPGDEQFTNVPSFIYPPDNNRDIFYTRSQILTVKGDHIRLQDIRLSYDINKQKFRKVPFQNIQLYVTISNLGILWRANEFGIDPDYARSSFNYTNGLPGKSIVAGLVTNF